MNENKNEQEFFCDDEDELDNSLENQLDLIKILPIGCIEDDSEAFTYLSLYKHIPNIAFHCSIIEPPSYIERYDVFEVKLNKNADFIRGFHVLGCLPEDIEYVELLVKLQEKKPRSICRFESNDIKSDKPTLFIDEYWRYLPNSFIQNKPEYYFEVQFKDHCPIINMVKIEIFYMFVSMNTRNAIEFSSQPLILKSNKKIEIKDKKMNIF